MWCSATSAMSTAVQHAVAPGEDPRLAVDLAHHEFDPVSVTGIGQIPREHLGEEVGDPMATQHGMAGHRSLATTVAEVGDVLGEQSFQALDVARCGRREERLDELVPLFGDRASRGCGAQRLAGERAEGAVLSALL